MLLHYYQKERLVFKEYNLPSMNVSYVLLNFSGSVDATMFVSYVYFWKLLLSEKF